MEINKSWDWRDLIKACDKLMKEYDGHSEEQKSDERIIQTRQQAYWAFEVLIERKVRLNRNLGRRMDGQRTTERKGSRETAQRKGHKSSRRIHLI